MFVFNPPWNLEATLRETMPALVAALGQDGTRRSTCSSARPDGSPWIPLPRRHRRRPRATADRLRRFASERDWDQFHSPKNLAMALIVEAAELVEHFQWLTEAQSADLPAATRAKVADELADVLVYLVRIADRLDIDLLEATARKLVDNEAKYPAAKVRGSPRKYSDY